MVRVTFYGIDLVTLRSFFFWSLVILGVLTYGISLYEWVSNGRVVKRAKTAMLKKHGNKPMYLILANPIGGDGKARSIYDNILLPMLERAEIRSKLVMTKHAGHARSIAADIDPKSVDALILISGDGMVHEVMQGFADKCRNDADKLKELYQQVPLGLIPGGSSNGLAASFGHFDAVQGCIGIINGKQHLLDVQEIDLPAVEGKCGKKKLWDAHAFCFGIFADHDRLVETKLRSFGVALKGILAPIFVIGQRREYKCALEFLPGKPWSSFQDRVTKGYNNEEELPEVGKDGWRRLEGSFVAINIFNTSWAASDVHICPHAEAGGGAVDISVIRGGPSVTRFKLIQAFLGFSDASHLKLPFFELYRAKAWRLIPNMADDGERTTLDLSGEQFPLCGATSLVHHGMARMLAL